ncbi:hypothetical protein ABK905_11965 [Acerihabitans sp. KWT182]|uniref:Uncharacterized protein n=1 Tax=Acerihabitans sp. KWT182 TaxID=3157919 RepID=A0AAU7QEA5_9GAMM
MLNNVIAGNSRESSISTHATSSAGNQPLLKPIACALCAINNDSQRPFESAPSGIKVVHNPVMNAEDRAFRLQHENDKVEAIEKSLLCEVKSGFENENQQAISLYKIRCGQISNQARKEKSAASAIDKCLKSLKSAGTLDFDKNSQPLRQLKQPFIELGQHFELASQRKTVAKNALETHQGHSQHIKDKTCFNARIEHIKSLDISAALKNKLIESWQRLHNSVSADTENTVKILAGLSGTQEHVDRLLQYKQILKDNYGVQSYHIRELISNT